jgi:hypothetical protein
VDRSPWLAIENASGKELTRNDDADNSSDARLEWKAPEEGSYLVTVGSVTHQGAPDFRYELTAQTLEPDFKLVSNSDALLAAAGTTNSLKMSFKRLRGFTNELALVATNLPAGIQAEQIALPTKDGEVSLSFNCPTNMPAFNGPFQVVAIDKSSGGTRKVPFELVSRTENNGVPGGYSKLLVESTDQLWLTVKPSEPKAAADPK